MTSVISINSINHLTLRAKASARLRQHENLHLTNSESCQRLLNSIGIDSYIRPHRHLLDAKSELLVAVRGKFSLIIFKDNGSIGSTSLFGTEKYFNCNKINIGVQISPEEWHTVIALVPNSVLLEVKSGPFDPDKAKEYADWAPDEKSPLAKTYFKNLKRLI